MQRFFYNPNNEELILFNQSHVSYYHNKKLKVPFDDYIRGIIQDNALYLRCYYPFADLDDFTYTELMKKSGMLLNHNLKGILQALKNVQVTPSKIILNVSNADLKAHLNLCFV